MDTEPSSNPAETPDGQRYIAAARNFEQEGKYGDAIAIHASYLERFPDGPLAAQAREAVENILPEKQRGQQLLTAAENFRALLDGQRYEEARDAGEQILTAVDEFREPDRPIEDTDFTPNKVGGAARQELDRISALWTEFSSLREDSGRAVSSGNLEHARELLIKALRVWPDEGDAIQKRVGGIEQATGLWDTARRAFKSPDYVLTAKQCARILELVPGFKAALDLQAEAERLEVVRLRAESKRSRRRALIPLALVLAALLATWGQRRFAFIRDVKAFERAVTEQQDEALALRKAQPLAQYYQPAARFLDLSKARKRFENAYLRADTKLLAEFGGEALARFTASLEGARQPTLDFDGRAGHYETALQELPNVVRAALASKRDALLAKGRQLSQDKDWPGAETQFAAVLELPGFDRDAEAGTELEKVRKAKEEAERIAAHQAKFKAVIEKAAEAEKTEQWTPLLELTEQALEMEPDSAKAKTWRDRALDGCTLRLVASAEQAATDGDNDTALRLARQALAMASRSESTKAYEPEIRTWLCQRLLDAARQAKELNDWDVVLTHVTEALKLEPESSSALALREETTSPRLRIVTDVAGCEVPGVTVLVDGVPPALKTPAVLRLETGRSYRIRTELASQFGRYFQPTEVTYHVEEGVLQTLRLELRPRGAFVPVLDASFASVDGSPSDCENARDRQRKGMEKWALPLEISTHKAGVRFRLIPLGRFVQGSPQSDRAAKDDEQPTRRVTISEPFYMGTFEVTQAQWQKVMGANASHYQEAGPNAPAEMLSWSACQEFCQRLCQLEGVQEGTFRLPTEAEWEYACRAGSQDSYCFGDNSERLADFAWYADQFADKSTPKPVGGKRPNAWGLYDMHGNVYEWCQDWHGRYSDEAVTDPKGPTRGTARVLRGGVFCTASENCRSASRAWAKPEEAWKWRGVRLALSARHVGATAAPER